MTKKQWQKTSWWLQSSGTNISQHGNHPQVGVNIKKHVSNHHLDDQKHEKNNDQKNSQIQVTLSHHVPFANHPERYATLWDLRFFGRIRWEFCFLVGKIQESLFGSFFFEGFRVWKVFLQKTGIQWSDPIHIYTNQPLFQRGRTQNINTWKLVHFPGFGWFFGTLGHCLVYRGWWSESMEGYMWQVGAFDLTKQKS